MRLKALTTAVACLGLLFGAQVMAADPPNFDFYGFAVVPGSVGGALEVRSVLTNNGVVPTPIGLDFTTKQYTLVLSGTLASVVGIASNYSGATVAIYEDAIGGGTPADYANAATFTDGTLILSGAFDGNLIRNRFTANLGNFTGKIDFSGGSRLGDLSTPQDWPLGGGWSRSATTIPAGYQENWDGKIDLGTVAIETRSWEGLKQLYR